MDKLFSLFILIFLSNNVAQSQFLELSLEQSFLNAKRLELPILIIRYDQGSAKYAKNTKSSNSDSKLISILEIYENRHILEKEFVIYRLNTNSEKLEDINLQHNLIPDYSPNFILYSHKGELIYFYHPISYESENNFENIIRGLRDTLVDKGKLLPTRLLLESKLANDEISVNELYNLIKIRHTIHLKNINEINHYVQMNGKLDPDLFEIINQQTFKMSDVTSKYLIEMDENDPIYDPHIQFRYFNNICEEASRNKDSNEFAEAQKWRKHFEKEAMRKMNEEFPMFFNETVTEISIEQADLIDQFNFYKSNKDLAKIIDIGNELAINLLDDFDENRKVFTENKVKMSDFILQGMKEIEQPLDSSSLAAIQYHKNHRDKIILDLSTEYDRMIAEDLNNIAWTFYQLINEKSELKKALDWSEKSIFLQTNAANMDTYAHLLFKLGKKKKALKYEQKALELAIEEGNIRSIENIKQEITKFQTE